MVGICRRLAGQGDGSKEERGRSRGKGGVEGWEEGGRGRGMGGRR